METSMSNQHHPHAYRKNLTKFSRIPQILKVQKHTKIPSTRIFFT